MDSKMNLKSKNHDARSWQQAELDDDKGLTISKEKSALKNKLLKLSKGSIKAKMI
jgi:hypothetical protein